MTYDGKIEYWKLDPGMLAVDGKSFVMQFESKFNGKTIKMELFGFDTGGSQTGFSNPINITVTSSPSAVAMPTLPTTSTTNSVGKLTVNFSGGTTLLASQLNELWARVNYDSKTEYWKLDPGMLSVDGATFTMQFDSKFDGTTMKMELFGFDTLSKQTGFSNITTFTITSSASSVVMPTFPATPPPLDTETTGQIDIPFFSGSLLASQLTELWAKVVYDGKTEYWMLDPGMLAVDGLSVYMDFTSAFNGKYLQLEFYGIDNDGQLTGFTNPVNLHVIVL